MSPTNRRQMNALAFVALAAFIAHPTRAAASANATLQQAGNPQSYDVVFNYTTGEYEGVVVDKHPQSMLDDPVEAHVQFGGTCEPGEVLTRSELTIIPSNYASPDLEHEWSGETNYDHEIEAVGSNATQHFKVLEACNEALPGRPADHVGYVAPFTIWQLPLHQAKHKLFCGESETDTAQIPLLYNVKCGAAQVAVAPQGPTREAAPFSVTAAEVDITPNVSRASCPVQMNLAMSIESVGAGTAQFIVEAHDGRRSQPYTVQTQAQGGGYGAVVNQPFQVPEASGGGPLQAGGSLKVPTPGPGRSMGNLAALPGPGGPKAASQMKAADAPAGQHAGSFRIRVTSPNALVSSWEQFQIQCETAGLAIPGVLKQPNQPTHGGGLRPANPTLTGPRNPGVGTPSGKRQLDPVLVNPTGIGEPGTSVRDKPRRTSPSDSESSPQKGPNRLRR